MAENYGVESSEQSSGDSGGGAEQGANGSERSEERVSQSRTELNQLKEVADHSKARASELEIEQESRQTAESRRKSESKGGESPQENNSESAEAEKKADQRVEEACEEAVEADRLLESKEKEVAQAEKQQDSRRENLEQGFKDEMQSFAEQSPEALKGVLEQAFPNADAQQREQLFAKLADGSVSLPENLQIVGADQLNGAQAAYSPENGGTVSLSQELLSNPAELRKAFSEEVGHHLDAGFNKGDAPGDEGEIFSRGVEDRNPLGQAELSALRQENDRGTMVQDGQTQEVENRRTRENRHGKEVSGSPVLERKQTAAGTFTQYDLDKLNGTSHIFEEGSRNTNMGRQSNFRDEVYTSGRHGWWDRVDTGENGTDLLRYERHTEGGESYQYRRKMIAEDGSETVLHGRSMGEGRIAYYEHGEEPRLREIVSYSEPNQDKFDGSTRPATPQEEISSQFQRRGDERTTTGKLEMGNWEVEGRTTFDYDQQTGELSGIQDGAYRFRQDGEGWVSEARGEEGSWSERDRFDDLQVDPERPFGGSGPGGEFVASREGRTERWRGDGSVQVEKGDALDPFSGADSFEYERQGPQGTLNLTEANVNGRKYSMDYSENGELKSVQGPGLEANNWTGRGFEIQGRDRAGNPLETAGADNRPIRAEQVKVDETGVTFGDSRSEDGAKVQEQWRQEFGRPGVAKQEVQETETQITRTDDFGNRLVTDKESGETRGYGPDGNLTKVDSADLQMDMDLDRNGGVDNLEFTRNGETFRYTRTRPGSDSYQLEMREAGADDFTNLGVRYGEFQRGKDGVDMKWQEQGATEESRYSVNADGSVEFKDGVTGMSETRDAEDRLTRVSNEGDYTEFGYEGEETDPTSVTTSVGPRGEASFSQAENGQWIHDKTGREAEVQFDDQGVVRMTTGSHWSKEVDTKSGASSEVQTSHPNGHTTRIKQYETRSDGSKVDTEVRKSEETRWSRVSKSSLSKEESFQQSVRRRDGAERVEKTFTREVNNESDEEGVLKTYRRSEQSVTVDVPGRETFTEEYSSSTTSINGRKPFSNSSHKVNGKEVEAPKPDAVLDLSRPISVAGVQTAIDSIADERGESGGLGLHVEGAGKVYKAIQIGAFGDIDLRASKSDTGSTVLSFDYEAAAKVGLDLEFLKGAVGAGAGGTIKTRFNSSADAAAWLTENLHNINESAGGDLFQIQDSSFNYKKPTHVDSTRAFVFGELEAELGSAFKFRGVARGQSTEQTYHLPGGGVRFGSETSLSGSAAVELNLGGQKVNGSYRIEQFTQTGDPVTENNGTFRNHKASISLPIEDMKRMSPEKRVAAVAGFLTAAGVADGAEGAHAMAKEMMPFVHRAMTNPQAFGFDRNNAIGLTYEAQNVLENGQYNNQYQRLYLDSSVGYKREFDLGVFEGEFSAGVNQSEVIREWAGQNTDTYAQQIYTRSLDANGYRDDWVDFKKENPAVLDAVIQRQVSSDPNGPVAQAYRKGGFTAGVGALERQWQQQDKQYDQVDYEANQIANLANGWVFSSGEETQMLNVLHSHRDRPEMVGALLDRMESYGISREDLLSRTNAGNHRQELLYYYRLVDGIR